MAAFSSIALGIGAIASTYGTIKTIQGQKRIQEGQEKQQALATQRSRRQAIRQAQIARAQAIASAQGSGTLQSSGAQGGIGSVSSQLGESMGFSTQMSGISQNISSGFRAVNTGQSLTGIGGNLMSYGMNQGATFSGLFNSFKPAG